MFKIRKNNEVETERLILRKLKNDDFETFASIVGDDEIGKQLPKGEGYTYEEAKRWLDRIQLSWNENNYGVWGVINKESGNLIGYCGLNKIEELDEVEVLYGISKDMWGRGYATEAAYSSLRFGFEQLNFEKIIGLAKIKNIASINVLKKIGLKYKKDMTIFRIDVKYFELTREEFNNSCK
ncbi:GNAT family N-acetyltransferase [Caloranaerobacter ferrireducens]|uniref:GNAT family N-acetyltransferase n=1 Tax=Caloranaerobacter ferrireducens TaxID=1323370 RepID=UPI00084DE8B1|nr:GNAT family N-acetyltransferase [Caloranaerobacter ferrireducens]